MKYIFLNIKNMFIHEKFIAFIIILCVCLSSFVLNFSYGLYQNYNIKKYEENAKLNEIVINIKKGSKITKSDFQNYIESLSDSTLSDLSNIFIAGNLQNVEEGYKTLDNRFIYQKNKYRTPAIVLDGIKTEHNAITFGRYFSESEEATGEKVAVVATYSNGEWSEQSLALKVDDKHIKIGNTVYKVIGGSGTLPGVTVPFTAVPDDFVYDDTVILSAKKVLNRISYNEMKEHSAIYLNDSLIFPELDLPDTDSITIYKNIIVISGIMCIISVFNFAMIYKFIFEQRKKETAIFRINGCTKSGSFLMFYAECIFLSVPTYIIGLILFLIIKNILLNHWFEYFNRVYSVKSYIVLFTVYLVVFTIIISFTILRSLKANIVEEWRT